MMILSGDPPRSRVLSVLLILIVAALALAPFLFPGAKALNVATKICIFAALVASYDLLLGYTGSVSFAHTMFYGIGSYAIAIALYAMGPSWGAVAAGLAIGLPLAALLALGIGLFSLRVEAIFFAMITLAVASAFLVLASQLSWLTGGEDGRSFQLPELLRPGTVFVKDLFGFTLNGRTLTYYIIFIGCAAMILGLLRVVNSPFGRVLQAVRENRFRAEALGYRTVFHLTYANCLAALVAASAGALNAMWLRYAGPDTSLSFSIMLDILLDGGDRRHGHDLRRDRRRRDLHPGAELSAGADGRGLDRRRRRRPAAAAGAAASGPLAAVARAAVHRQRVFLPHGNRRTLARRRQALTAATEACCRYAHPQSNHAENARRVDAAIPIFHASASILRASHCLSRQRCPVPDHRPFF